MNATDPLDGGLAEAMAMIDTRAWGARLRIVAVIRQLERESFDGWARVSYRTLAARVKIGQRYASDLLSAKSGVMWRVERVLLRGEPGVGTRPTEYRVNPRIDMWRGVPWLETEREIRRLRLEAALRAPHRGTDRGLVPGSHVAALANLVPRSHVAAQESLVPRSMSRHNGTASAATSHRGTSDFETGPSLYVPGEADASLSKSAERESDDFVDRVAKAVAAKTRSTLNATLLAELGRLEGRAPADLMVAAVAAAPDFLRAPMIIRSWLPEVARAGAIPTPAGEPAGPTPNKLREELRVIARQITAYEADGGEAPSSLLERRQTCENELEKLLAGAHR